MTEPRVTVLGGGPTGLAVALGLARRGRSVTILDRDAEQPLDRPWDAYARWSRPSIPHSVQPHSLLARTRRTLRLHAPDVLDSILEAGAWENDLFGRLVKEERNPGDRDLVAVHCRRPVFECALRAAVVAEPRTRLLTATPGTGIALARQPGAPPRVTGVRVGADVLPTDVLVDASGRRSSVPRWLKEAGVELALEEAEACNVMYYSRYFELLPDADYPSWVGVLGPAGTTDAVRFSVFFGDNRTYAIVLGVPSWERGFRGLAHNASYMSAVRRFSSLAPFIEQDVGRPVTDVLPFGSLQNVFRPPLLDGAPPVLGLHLVGDAYCHTNPLFAWGICLGTDHGFQLSRLIDEHPGDPEAQALAFADCTAGEAEECFRAVAEEDQDRTRAWRGERREGPWLGRSFAGFVRECAAPAVVRDADVASSVLRRANLLDLPNALRGQTNVIQRVVSLHADLPRPVPGSFPTRDELLELLSGVNL